MKIRPIKEIQYKCKAYNSSNYETILKKIKWDKDGFCIDLDSEVLLQIYRSFSLFFYPQYFKEELESVAPEISVVDRSKLNTNTLKLKHVVIIEISKHIAFKQDKLENPQWFEV